MPSTNYGTLKEQTQLFQKNWIINALRKTNGIQKKAAEVLGVKPTTLNEMIKRFDIDINNLED
jgi:transcriptional regulator with GAF, ATPase, and Fis domain